MKYFQIHFVNEHAVEGKGFKYKQRFRCPKCGLKAIPARRDFVTPEDTVDVLDATIFEPLKDQPFFSVVDQLVSTRAFCARLTAAHITGFEPAVATVALTGDEDGFLPDFVWLKITGRCKTNDLWNRVVSVCRECESELKTPVENIVRRPYLLEPPEADLSRARERTVGIIASERFVDAVRPSCLDYSRYITFKEIEVR